MRITCLGWLVATAWAVSAPAEPKPISSELQSQLKANLARGDSLYNYDQSAWHITDAMFEAIPENARDALRGYVVAPDGEALRTVFFGEENGRHVVIYAATWERGIVARPEIHLDGPRPAVTAEQEHLIAARGAVLAPDVIGTLGLCSDASPNIIAIPGATADEPISVYIMTPQTEKLVWPLGGHSRVEVKNGKIQSRRAFTKSCVNLSGKDEGDSKVAMLMVTHHLDKIPTEIHAFTVHASQLPLGVGTEDGSFFTLYRTNGKIVYTQDK